jgi:hypothetical protein
VETETSSIFGNISDSVVVPNMEVLKVCDIGASSNSTEHVEDEGTCGT